MRLVSTIGQLRIARYFDDGAEISISFLYAALSVPLLLDIGKSVG